MSILIRSVAGLAVAAGSVLTAAAVYTESLALAALLNLWGLSTNGWTNTFYSAAVRSMSTSWHDFLFVSLDKTGLMSVDKPPLALWCRRCRRGSSASIRSASWCRRR